MSYIIIIGLIVVGVFLIKFRVKHTQNIGNLTIVTGGVKAGKSSLSVHLALKRIKKARFAWHIRRPFRALFRRPAEEEPLLYSNVPLAVPYYTPLKHQHLTKEERFNYRSVVYIQEASLVADSMSFKDEKLNQATLELFKLIAHETRGGYLICDTQCIADVHYNLKRSISTYLYVHRTIKIFPFLLFSKVQERVFDPVSSMNVNVDGDADNANYRWVVFPKSTWKVFDRYCYSVLTDDLPHEAKKSKPKSLKATNIITFRKGAKK